MESDKPIIPELHLFHPLRTLGHVLVEGFRMHQLSQRSDHFPDVQDPYIEPADQPAVDWHETV